MTASPPRNEATIGVLVKYHNMFMVDTKMDPFNEFHD